MQPMDRARTPQPSLSITTALPAPAIPTGPDESQQSPSAFPPRTAPTTPPPTPTSSFVDEYSTPLMLHELTRAKLERAASGQMSGRRGAPSLRQIVLLSNVFGAASRPSPEQDAREQELLELDRRRKEDEERWLDTLLEEMLEVEDDDDSDDYVQVSFRGESMGDSGYLEESREPYRPEPLEAIGEEELDYRDPRTSEAANGTGGAGDDDEPGHVPNPISRPHSPPLPCRSPPISLPDRPTRIGSYILDPEPDFDSSSPPDVPPPLIEDCSPPSSGMSSLSLSGTSADSAESDLEEERDRWLATRGTTRPGLLSVDSPALHSPKHPTGQLEIVYPPSHTSFATPPTFARRDAPYYADSLATLPSAGPLAGALVRQQTIIFPSAPTTSWTPRPPRSLSVPATPRRQLSPSAPRTSSSSDRRPMHPTFHGGVVKSYYDFVDFGGSTSEQLPALADPARSRGRDDLALVLASAPLPQFGSGGYRGVGWRSRSLSPDGRGRRDWARLGDVVDDAASDP